MDFFTKLTPWIQFSLVVAVFIVVLLILAVVFYAIKNKNIKIKGVSISDNSSIEEHNQEEKSPHADCEYKLDIEILLLQQQEMLDKCYRIRTKEIISMCMKEVEEELYKIYYAAMAIFRKSVANLESIDIDELHKNYKNFCDVMKEFVIVQMRTWIRENHFAERTESEFDVYAKNKSDNLKEAVLSFSQEIKPEFESEEYKKEIQTIYMQIGFATILVLKKCRAISIQKLDEAKKLENDFNAKVTSILGKPKKYMEGEKV